MSAITVSSLIGSLIYIQESQRISGVHEICNMITLPRNVYYYNHLLVVYMYVQSVSLVYMGKAYLMLIPEI